MPTLVTKQDAMEVLQVSLRTVDRYIADGILEGVRLTPRTTRITRRSLDELVSPNSEPTPTGTDAGAPAPSYGAPALSTSGAPEAPPSAASPKAGAPASPEDLA